MGDGRAPRPSTSQELEVAMSGPDALTRSVLADQVKERLLEAILDGSYPPDSRIVETAVAKELGTSQAPVREALRGLEALGIVEITPFRGARVRRLDAAELLEAYVVRSAIEVLGARLAMARITDDDVAALAGDRRGHAPGGRRRRRAGPGDRRRQPAREAHRSSRATAPCCACGGRWSRCRAPTSRWSAPAPTRSGPPPCTTRCSTRSASRDTDGGRARHREPLRRGARAAGRLASGVAEQQTQTPRPPATATS